MCAHFGSTRRARPGGRSSSPPPQSPSPRPTRRRPQHTLRDWPDGAGQASCSARGVARRTGQGQPEEARYTRAGGQKRFQPRCPRAPPPPAHPVTQSPTPLGANLRNLVPTLSSGLPHPRRAGQHLTRWSAGPTRDVCRLGAVGGERGGETTCMCVWCVYCL